MDSYTAQQLVDALRAQAGAGKYRIYRGLGGVWYLSDCDYMPIASRSTFEEIRQTYLERLQA